MPDERAKDAWPCGSFTKERERQDTHSSQAAAAKYCVLLFSQGGENLPERLRHHMGTKNLKKNVMPGFAANELHQEANDDDDCREDEEPLYKMLRCFHFNSLTKYYTVKWDGLTNREKEAFFTSHELMPKTNLLSTRQNSRRERAATINSDVVGT